MLSQEQQFKPYKKIEKFEDMALYKPEDELVPLHKAIAWAIIIHTTIIIIAAIYPFILSLLGIDLNLLNKVQLKPRDIQFILVSQPEEKPINKNTPFRAEKDTRAGGINDPNKPIAPPEPALPKSAQSQQNNQKQQKSEPAPKQTVKPQKKAVSQPQKTIQAPKQEAPKTVSKPAPTPPKPMAKPHMPIAKAPGAMKLPVAPSKGGRLSSIPTGPVSSKPRGSYGTGSSSGQGKTVSAPRHVASGTYGTGAGIGKGHTGSGKGSSYSPGGGSVGNPGPGNPKGRPGVDAIREPNFGPYMAELQRRIKANWDPPRGDESKRVVLLFTIAKDGRLQSIKVVKSSGSAAADKAAQAAVELTAPFRPLPSDFNGPNIDIQFTFDYNVFGVNSRY